MKIHFIGIGGIGVSALAKYYLEKGHKVSGSDLVCSEITDALKKKGAKIFIGPHRTRTLLVPVDLVVYSPAVQSDNPELKEARRLKIKTQSYPQVLGELTKKHFTIAVSGTHGKSTTTAMLGLLLEKAGFNPTVIVGTKVKEFGGSNCRVGRSEYLVIEACEHEESFLNYWPKIIVLTNIEKDHLDYYKNLKNILKAFEKFVKHLPKDGVLVFNQDDKNILKLKTQISEIRFETQNYFLRQREVKRLRKILKIPGEYNLYNALAVLTVARILKISDKISFETLSKYQGSWRRFEEKELKIEKEGARRRREGEGSGVVKLKVISDYAHHPTEIKVTLEAAREKYPQKEIWCIFQPHQYQRTYYLFKDFVKVLKKAPVDKLIITDIYDVAGREEKKTRTKVNSEKLVKAINKTSVSYLPQGKIIDYLKENLKGGEILMIMGAGDIYKLSEKLKY